jgi:uncharacterized protein YukE
MSEITYHYGHLADYHTTLGNTAASLTQLHDDLRNLAAALSEGHLGQHSDAWQAGLTHVNTSLAHFSDVVMHFGTTHANVTDHAMTVDASLANGIGG